VVLARASGWTSGSESEASDVGEAFRLERRSGVGNERCFSSVRPSGWRGGPESKARPPGRRGGPKSEAGAVPPGQAFQSKIGSPFWPIVRYLGRPRNCASFVMLSAGPSFCRKAGLLRTLSL